MKTAVYQSFRTVNVPPWIARCLASVQQWAALRGHDYHFLDDRFFSYTPDWYRRNVKDNVLLVSDLARLLVARELFNQGYDCAVWVDADVIVFDPEGLKLDLESGFGVCREVWVHRRPDGTAAAEERLNNAVLTFARDNAFLDFYTYSCQQIVAFKPRYYPYEVGTGFLTHLGKYLPLPLIENVGLFSPTVMAAIAADDTGILQALMQHVRTPLCAANLCASFNNREYDGVHMTEHLFTTVLDRCLQSRGAVVNCYLATANHTDTPNSGVR